MPTPPICAPVIQSCRGWLTTRRAACAPRFRALYQEGVKDLDRVYRRMALDYGAAMTRTLLAAKPWKQLKEQGQ